MSTWIGKDPMEKEKENEKIFEATKEKIMSLVALELLTNEQANYLLKQARIKLGLLVIK